MIKVPPPLNQGDKIAIVATARKIDYAKLEFAIDIIEKWGFEPIVGDTIGKADCQMAGTDLERAADLQKMLDDSAVKAILFARGGYGTVRMVDFINWEHFCASPKWLIGYSDITVLHSHIHRHCQVETIHGPMASGFPQNLSGTLENLRRILEGERLVYKAEPHYLNRNGKAEGILIGGNLSMIYSLLGSQTDIDTNGKILFLEDLDEYLYHIDRMMINLKRGGKLAKLAGLVVGGMTDMSDNDIPFGKDALQIVAEHVSDYDFPLAFDFPAGHMVGNYPMIFGAVSQLRVEATGSLLKNGVKKSLSS